MTYVDLNPIRAGIACKPMGSRNTSMRKCCKATLGQPESAAERLRLSWGIAAPTMPPITVGEYIELVGDTVRQVKLGAISAVEPRVLQKLGISADHWTRKVKGVRSGFWRVVGTVDDIQEKRRR